MAKLEEIVPGVLVSGLVAKDVVTIVAAQWLAPDSLLLTFTDSEGRLSSSMCYREDENHLALQQKGLPWSFDGDGEELQLASEAWRIHYAHLFDPLLAVHSSDVEPLPHQISAVYKEMLPLLPLRYILADDPGAGKTIMTGLFIRELICRGDLERCLIVCPGSLVEQWQEELFRKFHLRFQILTQEKFQGSLSGNAFAEAKLAIARLDMLARNEELQKKLAATEWDLIVCDEAHKMSASFWGGQPRMTHRYQLGQKLSEIARHFLLLTATPHNGKEQDFQLFLALIDPDQFGNLKQGASRADVSGIMRRLVKEELLKFDGSKLFPDREAITLNYTLSPLEAQLYQEVTAYVQSEFNRADKLDDKIRINVGFALTVLQRRLASSPEAIFQSLRRRRERLENRLAAARQGLAENDTWSVPKDIDDAMDDYTALEMENLEEQMADRASAARGIMELETEIATLARLEQLAARVRASGTDRKWEELSRLLQNDEQILSGDMREKLVIFTEHRDTLRYLTDKIRSLLGNDAAVINIYGGMSQRERRQAEEMFRQDGEARILIATDAAGEGINLQCAHLMINYDLPWNPNRLEQRFGRIHRIGQKKTCLLWNLVASETREGAVFQRLFDKLNLEKEALGGKVFDVLGKLSFNNRSLRDLIIEAVRREDSRPAAAIVNSIDMAMEHKTVLELLENHALTEDIMTTGIVASMREEMERLEARRLQPHYIESFFRKAFTRMGGRMTSREQGRHEISHVPAPLRNRASRDPVLRRYERVCFDKRFRDGRIEADLICPGHPLLDALIDAMRERGASLLKRGAILVDEADPGEKYRVLFYIESALQDGEILPNGQCREISRQIHFVEQDENGFSINAGHVPYLNYRACAEKELETLLHYAGTLPWLKGDLEFGALSYAAKELVPLHRAEVRERRLALIEKTRNAVRERLTAEIQYWDSRANELKEKENEGKRNAALNSAQARAKADLLAERREARLAQLDREAKIDALPPRVTGGVLVAPIGLLRKLGIATPADFCEDAAARKRIEDAAMAAVMANERRLGYIPKDVSAEKRGYDIESASPENMPDGPGLRFIEVKGRAKGARKVNMTLNEIIIALNNPDKFILALVEVDGENTKVCYIKQPFQTGPEQCCFNIASLLENAATVTWQD